MKTNQDIAMELAHRTCTKYLHAPDSSSVQYSFSARHLTDFVEKLIAARAIEAEATKPKFHTTELRNPPEAVFSCGEATKPCVCGDSSAQGVFHRNDGPCYITVEEATNPQEPVAVDAERGKDAVAWVDVVDRHEGPYNFHGKELLDSGKHNLYTTPQPCQSCAEKQSAIDVWEGRYADLSAKCAELEDFCISQGNELAKLDEKVFDQDRLLKQQAEKISATLVALAGLPDGALDGGWTYAGMNKYALGLEVKCAELEAERDALAMQNQQMREALESWSHVEYALDLPLLQLRAIEALTLPAAFEIIKRHDAAVLRKAAEHLHAKARAYLNEFDRRVAHDMASALEKSCPPSN